MADFVENSEIKQTKNIDKKSYKYTHKLKLKRPLFKTIVLKT